MQFLFIDGYPTILAPTDFGIGGGAYFQLLSTLCKLAQAAIQKSIDEFQIKTFLSAQAISEFQFLSRMTDITSQFESNTASRFSHAIQLVRDFVHGNTFVSSYAFNWYFWLDDIQAQKTILASPAIKRKQCSEIVTTLLPLISFVTGVSPDLLPLPIQALNSLLPKLKKLLGNEITEYKPVGQCGFIRSLMSFNELNNEDGYDWMITCKSNCVKLDRETNTEKFIVVISKKLIESFGPSTTTITNASIINHNMEKYISSLKSCDIIPMFHYDQTVTQSLKKWRHGLILNH
ncbi:unnamed protein product [Rotaria sp. Silwood2]|nr:unnamed protein product [Rotaria sp. Silwood2]CAF3004118.1 unnamed protein product [Rotaria sp. Silwood2]CAF4193541.1 unnamed protein product [Rotaria sp. Silwood2]CAF4197135.1 unnamed protein product [Rotaria sp. Silwood2]